MRFSLVSWSPSLSLFAAIGAPIGADVARFVIHNETAGLEATCSEIAQ
jgi:hypothetical protein